MSISKTLEKLKAAARSPPQPFRFPTLEDRVTINGHTGSGKTVGGAWLLANAEFDKQPFVIINFKREKLFRAIKRAVPLEIDDDLPDAPGLYHMEPLATEEARLEEWLWRVWRKGATGLFIDEGYLMPRSGDSPAFKAILTTGRSLLIPVYTLTQRPVSVPRFVFSEATFYQSYNLNDRRDRKIVEEFTPDDETWSGQTPLPKFHSRWRDQSEDFSCTLGPCPDTKVLLAKFDARLTPRQTML